MEFTNLLIEVNMYNFYILFDVKYINYCNNESQSKE
jgi:hypothetical protein